MVKGGFIRYLPGIPSSFFFPLDVVAVVSKVVLRLVSFLSPPLSLQVPSFLSPGFLFSLFPSLH